MKRQILKLWPIGASLLLAMSVAAPTTYSATSAKGAETSTIKAADVSNATRR